jgi:DNA-directed RNA polymerase specialized sigma24 family protein
VWPDDYIDWALRARPPVTQSTHRWLDTLLGRHPRLSLEAGSLAEEATQEVFRLAAGRRQIAEYLPDEMAFRRWVGALVLLEALRRLLGHAEVGPELDRLTSEQRRLLGMRYLDRLPPGDVAAILGLSTEQVQRQSQDALQRLWDLLR